jgi:hypothetical protein
MAKRDSMLHARHGFSVRRSLAVTRGLPESVVELFELARAESPCPHAESAIVAYELPEGGWVAFEADSEELAEPV